VTTLHDHTLLLLLIFPGGQGGPRSVFKHLPHALVRLRRALEVLLGTNLLADILGLLRVSGDGETATSEDSPAQGSLASARSCGALQ
jgi:hypothetical protein